jgi:agmatinase
MGTIQSDIAARRTTAPARAFLDWPIGTDPSGWSADVAVIGLLHSEPYAKDPWPNDQTNAPAAIRAMSSQFSDGPDHWDFDLDAPMGEVQPPCCLDCGDIVWDGVDYDAHAERVTALIGRLFARGSRVFVLGGDHGVTIPVVDALAALDTPVHIVHFDAHLDWRADIGGVPRGYSSPLRWASKRPWISGMTQIGLRGTGSARRGEVEAARAYGSHLFTAKEVHAEGLERALDTVPAGVAVYVTIDADGLDPTEMPGVMGPVPGGVYFRQIAPFLRSLGRKCRIVGGDIVEIAPSFDASNHITCITAGRLIVNLIGASQLR